MARKRIGEVLLRRGAITEDQLALALDFQREKGIRLGAALIAKGFLTEEDLAAALGEALDLPVIDIPDTVDLTALHLLKATFCELHEVFPLHLEAGSSGRRQLSLAAADPLDLPVIEEISFVTGCSVVPVLATPSQIRLAILRHYHRQNIDLRGTAGGQMTVVRPGGATEVVETARKDHEPDPIDDDEVLSLTEEVTTADRDLAHLIEERERGRKRPKRSRLAQDLGFLTGHAGASDLDRLESLERKFWALMRLMAKKGLLDKDEFLSEFDE